MEKLDVLNQVAEFHENFRHPILKQPKIPSPERSKLRLSLLEEELKELKEAVQNNDLIEVADALCDIQYVLSGAILEFGLGNKFNGLFNEVQRSNMSKACKSEEEAKNTVEYYKIEKNTDCYYKKSGVHYLVFRTSDNKTLKSINYSPADLGRILF